jgi:nicotinamidase-related amidase
MPRRNPDLHGSVPAKSRTALLLIDVINDLEFDGGDKLLKPALTMSRALLRLKDRARSAGIPAIYVNDNFGRWTSDFRHLVDHCLNDGVRGEALARQLAPVEGDYFVLKPKHSGFFSTTLHLVLKYIGAKAVIVTGLTTDVCVTFTANDAYMHEYKVFVPSDCSASFSPREHRDALADMRRIIEADTRASSQFDLRRLHRRGE